EPGAHRISSRCRQRRRARRADEPPVPARHDERRHAPDDRQRGEQAPAGGGAAPGQARYQPDARLGRLPGAEMRAPINTRTSTLDSPRRRRLLKAAAASGLLAAVERNFALAQAAADYKALVCINLAGGNDGENTLIPYDSAGYQAYAAIRSLASGINIPQ